MAGYIKTSSARQYVECMTPFNGYSLYARINHLGYYVVYSYGPHHPLVAAVPQADGQPLWFANRHKHSTTASRHLSQSLPLNVDVTWLDPDQLRTLIWHGYDALIRDRLSIPL